jgi:hypothetical protein
MKIRKERQATTEIQVRSKECEGSDVNGGRRDNVVVRVEERDGRANRSIHALPPARRFVAVVSSLKSLNWTLAWQLTLGLSIFVQGKKTSNLAWLQP